MKKHIVFLLHGVGKQQEDWSKEIVDNLKTKADKIISENQLQPFYEVEYVELFYSDLLDQNMQIMIEGGENLGEVNEFLKKGLKERNDPNFKPATTQDKIAAGLRDYALDVPTYALNPDFTNALLVRLAIEVTKTIADNPDAAFSFVSHSLGTKVSFDLLHKLYVGQEYYSVSPEGTPIYPAKAFNSYYQLASVAWVIGLFDYSNITPNDSFVRVFKQDGIEQNGIVLYAYRIFNNNFDPIAWIGKSDKIKPRVYSTLNKLDYIDRAWMHDFNCYIDHPEVHLKMVEDFYGVTIKEDVKQQTIEAYNNSEKNLKHDFKEFFDELKIILNEGTEAQNKLAFIKSIITIIDKLKTISK